MKSLYVESSEPRLTEQQQEALLERYLDGLDPEMQRVLLIPPDHTRKHCGAGRLTEYLYWQFERRGVQVDIMPALGTHVPMTTEELQGMFGADIPLERFLVHDWRHDTEIIGVIPETFVEEVSEGIVRFPIEVRVNQRLLNGEYDQIISIGQVVPHEVVGMANHNKNIFVGCGGVDMINKSHFLGAAYDMERLLGRDHSPVRKVYDYAQEKFLQGVPLTFVLTANGLHVNKGTGMTDVLGLYIGDQREVFEWAVAMSQKHNITVLAKPLQKVVVFLDPEEFKSTWLGCKAVYRTRMAIADGGELIMIAPGLRQFGEDAQIDPLLRKYGYAGRTSILQWTEENEDLQHNLSAAAHLIHGSSDGRFSITVASNMDPVAMTKANFRTMALQEALAIYDVNSLQPGPQMVNGEEIYYIDNPATGLWVSADKWQS